VKVLISLQDVEPAVRLNALLESAGFETAVVSPLDDMRATLRRERPDVMVFTGDVGDPSTVALVRDQLWSGTSAIGLLDVDDPDLRERLRAVGFVELFAKPASISEVGDAVRRILERRELQRQTGLFGESEAMREVLVKVEQMAAVTSTVLIEGESGTGKELVARALRMFGPRRNRAFIAVNVGALPETLLESELFGHEKGAFTGAAERRIGRFELADGGTIFLDEIGEVPPATQVKLLRVLEEREITRLGGTTPISIDVRVVAATNQSLRELVEGGRFRSDLYYRLNVLYIYLPPLRERRDDIPLLVRRYVQEFSTQHDRPFRGISAEAMEQLVSYPWPGNVRELRNFVESMVVLGAGREIRPEDLPEQIREGAGRLLPVRIGPLTGTLGETDTRGTSRELEFIVRSLVELKLQVEELRRRLDSAQGGARDGWLGEVTSSGLARPIESRPPVAAIEPQLPEPPMNVVTVVPGMTMEAVERAMIEAALRETRGNRRRAAELLGIGERTLYRKIKEYALALDDAPDDSSTRE